ncbi:Protein LYK5 [Acorus gramineus]|uniref:Protein LYK5 n=1 Tax=Acorus gramineus TaxID=55184 RepID=A0AAV9AUJ6_ACOGR|nr:Protein LYK5 [Acorus gramineus]
MIDQNIYDSRHLEVGMRLTVPLRCACPSLRQLNGGVRYLLSYLITWGDTVGDIGRRFRADERATLEANLLSPDDLIYPFTPLLVPMKSAPTKDEVFVPPPPLMVYKYEDLERATGFFDEEHRIKGSVFKGVINGDHAAIKRTKGDVLNEICVLKNINHSSVIKLSGLCVHEGIIWSVYQYANNGSLSDWIHYHPMKKKKKKKKSGMETKVRVAYDIADGLNYLHNYTNPPCVHKNLKSSNIILDGEFKAKIVNFGLTRSAADEDEGLKVTRRVVGTQGYMAPEYIEHGLITPKMDVFAYGVVLLELLPGREAAAMTPVTMDGEKEELLMLWESMEEGFLEGEDVREEIEGFVDPCLENDYPYPFELAFALVRLAMSCVACNPGSRLSMREVFVSISMINSSSMDWDPSLETSKFRRRLE